MLNRIGFILIVFQTKLLSWILRTFLNRIISMMTIFSVITLLLIPGGNAARQYLITMFGYAIVFCTLFAFSYKRVSNNTIYNRFTNRVTMNILDTDKYYRYSYKENKEKISSLLKKEFIEGFKKIHMSSNLKQVSFTTHKWLVENVVLSPELLSLYEPDILKKNQYKKINKEIISLISFKELMKFESNVMKSIDHKRQAINVKLSRLI